MSVFGFLLAFKPQLVYQDSAGALIFQDAFPALHPSAVSSTHSPCRQLAGPGIPHPFVAICPPRCPARLRIPTPEAHGVSLSINVRHKQVGSSGWLHCLSWSPGLCLPIVLPLWSPGGQSTPISVLAGFHPSPPIGPHCR